MKRRGLWLVALGVVTVATALLTQARPSRDLLYDFFVRYGPLSDSWYDDTPASDPRVLVAIDAPVGRTDEIYLLNVARKGGWQLAAFRGSMVLVAGLPATETAVVASASSIYVDRNSAGQVRVIYARKPTVSERLAHLVGGGVPTR